MKNKAHTHTWRIVFSSMPLPFMVSQHSHTHAIDLTWKENHFQVWAYNMRSWSCTTKWVNVIEVRSMQYMRSTYTPPPPPPPHCHLIHTHERYTLDTSHEVMEQFQSSHKLRKPVQGVHAELKKKQIIWQFVYRFTKYGQKRFNCHSVDCKINSITYE